LSLLFAEFFRSTSSAVTLDLFLEFTACKYLPQIHVDAALMLLDTECKLKAVQKEQQEEAEKETTTMTAAATNGLSSLKDRCIEALTQQ
jgi:hypothetical protein